MKKLLLVPVLAFAALILTACGNNEEVSQRFENATCNSLYTISTCVYEEVAQQASSEINQADLDSALVELENIINGLAEEEQEYYCQQSLDAYEAAKDLEGMEAVAGCLAQ
ncbi:MAG: hypothetical protein PHU61_01420 [Candidatus Absconditabacteria bacterium]|nr:hypothetical protein [Candidatus Absconditabacteria bacterium]MDD3868040.1 hypothetical protein [Candidatus Absconditabacteria bacterium]MDD4714287.1 hypothetical protein [Candidatus Absconditabacteria bacterium]